MNEPLNSNNRLRSDATLEGWVAICDGVNANLISDGVTTRILGIRPPLTAPSVANGSGSNVDAGDHLVYVTFAIVMAGQIICESNPQSATVTYTAPGGTGMAVTSIPLSDNDAVNARILYMTSAGGSVPYRVGLGATISDNTTTTHTVDVADADLTSIELSFANAFIPSKPIVEAQNNQFLFWGDVPWILGTVAVTSGSKTLTFTGAKLTRAMEGKLFYLTDSDVAYTIDTVNVGAQTALLTANYGSTTQSGKTYVIAGSGSDLYISNTISNNVEGYDVTTGNSVITIRGEDGPCSEFQEGWLEISLIVPKFWPGGWKSYWIWPGMPGESSN